MEFNGIPIDVRMLSRLQSNWEALRDKLIARIDADFSVYEGHTFKIARFKKYLVAHHIDWPLTPWGRPSLDDDTFGEQCKSFPELRPLKELRYALGQLRLHDLAVDGDGRNRAMLSMFRSKTGRNQPSTSRFIFGLSAWLRGLIRPQPGYGLAYVDWAQQEFGIAAALSGDKAMIEAYRSGDPYLAFAKQSGAAPDSATKETHASLSGSRWLHGEVHKGVHFTGAKTMTPTSIPTDGWHGIGHEAEPELVRLDKRVIQERNRQACLKWLGRFGWLTSRMVSSLIWAEAAQPMSMARRTLKDLVAEKFVISRPLTKGGAAYLLAAKGARLLQEQFGIQASSGNNLQLGNPIHRSCSNWYLIDAIHRGSMSSLNTKSSPSVARFAC